MSPWLKRTVKQRTIVEIRIYRNTEASLKKAESFAFYDLGCAA